VTGNGERDGLKMMKIIQWAISSEASLETEMNVQRLLKFPKVFTMEKVNCFSGDGNSGRETKKRYSLMI
jgi:hypothetical protein